MPEFRMTRRVRYRECDPMGVVYHTHYLDWFEEARTEALRDAGLPYAELERDGLQMPVVDLAARYIRPVRYDDEVEIVTRMQDAIPTSRVRFDYEIHRQEEPSLAVTGHVTLCFFDPQRGRPIAAPSRVIDAYRQLLHD